ncbi:MAG: hypothetical protein MZW92_13985 [Comamonadaceae bacterium]|nr:hypothetical protein [Comamonadaceae bacterium]
MVRGWTPDGRILFVSTHGQPFFRNYRACTLGRRRRAAGAAAAGPGQPPGLRPGQGASVHRPQHRRPGALEALPRRHRRPPVGRRRRAAATFRRMTRAAGQHHQPDVDRRAASTSCRDCRGRRQPVLAAARRQRTCAATPTTPTSTRATRRPTAARIVYQCGAELWLFDPAGDATRAARRSRVPSAPHAGRAPLRRRGRAPATASTLHPAGPQRWRSTRAASCSRSPLWEGAVRQHGAADGVRHRLGQWLADGRRWWRSATPAARSASSVLDADGTRARCAWDIGRVIALRRRAARRRRVAIANHRNEVLIGDLDSGALTRGRPQRRRPHRGPGLVARRRLARLPVLDQPAALRDQAVRASATRPRSRWSRSRSSATTRRPSTRTAATCTSCRCAPSTRCTTACSSS